MSTADVVRIRLMKLSEWPSSLAINLMQENPAFRPTLTLKNLREEKKQTIGVIRNGSELTLNINMDLELQHGDVVRAVGDIRLTYVLDVVLSHVLWSLFVNQCMLAGDMLLFSTQSRQKHVQFGCLRFPRSVSPSMTQATTYSRLHRHSLGEITP